MRVRNAAHKGLKKLLEKNDPSKLPPEDVERIRELITFFRAMRAISEFFGIPRGKPHVLTGDRKGTHSIAVRSNWRLTFRYDEGEFGGLSLKPSLRGD
jgi:proteic killer suppression protein